MPRRNSRPHPSTLKGHPEHGDPFPEDERDDEEDELEDEDQDDDSDDDDDEDEDKPLSASEARALRREMDSIKQTNAALIRQAPPREPDRDDDEEEEVDWDTLLFSNPKEAVRQIKAEARQEITREMRGEYQKDQGEKEFWSDFNKKHPDLKDDRDIVEFELQKNLAKLGDMPVQEALNELADLTRKRLMRYSGGKGRKKSRAHSEGSNAPSGRKAPVEKKRPTTLADVIKARQEARRKAATVG